MIGAMTIVTVAMAVLSAAAASEGRPGGETYAVIVGGTGKDPQDLVIRGQVLTELRAYLAETASVKPERLVVLSSDAATSQEIKRAVEAFALAAREKDRFVFYYIGQANGVRDSLRFNLSGPDITQNDLAGWLAGVKAGTQLVVLDCPCAAVAAKDLAHPGRVVVLASTETQVYAPRFSLHFVPALARELSDTKETFAIHADKVARGEVGARAGRGFLEWPEGRADQVKARRDSFIMEFLRQERAGKLQ
jgi:hypothetical protein